MLINLVKNNKKNQKKVERKEGKPKVEILDESEGSGKELKEEKKVLKPESVPS